MAIVKDNPSIYKTRLSIYWDCTDITQICMHTV